MEILVGREWVTGIGELAVGEASVRLDGLELAVVLPAEPLFWHCGFMDLQKIDHQGTSVPLLGKSFVVVFRVCGIFLREQ